MKGPVPKRSTERRRRNIVNISHVPAVDNVTIPKPDPKWHPVATRWYSSLATSGQRIFYENSDWAQAFYIAEVMSRNLQDDRLSGNLFAAVISASTELLTTEGARRRMRVELERATAEHAVTGAAILDDYRRMADQPASRLAPAGHDAG